MRMRIELVLTAIVVAVGWGLAYADGPGWRCQGSYNCKTSNCYDAGAEGHSCGLMAAENHKKCEQTFQKADNCKDVSKLCCTVSYYDGGPCDNANAPYCPGLFTGETKSLYETGCN